MDLGKLELPPTPRSGRCPTCSGEIKRTENPKPGVIWAEACCSCGKWFRWALEPGRIDG